MSLRRPTFIGLLTGAICVQGCSSDTAADPQMADASVDSSAVDSWVPDSPADDAGGLRNLGDFVRQPDDRPVISSGVAGLPMLVADPAVYSDAEGYHLFYTTLFCKKGDSFYFSFDPAHPSDCDLSQSAGMTAYAFSNDKGLTWEFRTSPVIAPPSSLSWDATTETPFVTRTGDQLLLFYCAHGYRQGKPFAFRYQVGVATLDLQGASLHTRLMDPSQQFARRAEPLLPYDVLTTSFTNNTQEPSVVASESGLDVYFVGLRVSLPDQPIDNPDQKILGFGLGRAKLDSSLHLTSPPEGAILEGANITEVRTWSGATRVFSTLMGSGGEFHKDEKIGYYSSVNQVQWDGPRLLLQARESSPYENWGLMAPTVALEDTEVVLFYTAWGTQAAACDYSSPTGRVGVPVENSTRCVYGTLGRATAPRLP
ncbi:MAG: hypothetical protein HY898_04105 [Deltaproteobacteria bacterium]|nr:hypothetical protein [Deltaproteobacteria bacterium]